MGLPESGDLKIHILVLLLGGVLWPGQLGRKRRKVP